MFGQLCTMRTWLGHALECSPAAAHCIAGMVVYTYCVCTAPTRGLRAGIVGLAMPVTTSDDSSLGAHATVDNHVASTCAPFLHTVELLNRLASAAIRTLLAA